MVDKTTNVSASELNYDKYESEIYDDDIRRSIPGYDQLHKVVEKTVREYSRKRAIKKILELGIGTGLTSEKILKIIPTASLIAIDFSEQMMSGAKKRLSKYNVRYIFHDYSEADFDADFDIVLSVIGIHHQSDKGKKELFKKISHCLKPGGMFIFGDLFTYRNQKKAAVNEARHYHHLVENARHNKALEDWSHHHKFQNILAPIEDQVEWLKKSGFSSVKVKYEHMSTALIIAVK